MPTYANLEISLDGRDDGSYSVDLRFNQPRSDADLRLIREGSAGVRLNLDELRQSIHDPRAYGQLLTRSLFSDPIREAFAMARKIAQGMDSSLRVRLFLRPSATELHG